MSGRKWVVTLLALGVICAVVMVGCMPNYPWWLIPPPPTERPVVRFALTWEALPFVATDTPTFIPGIWVYDQSLAVGDNCPAFAMTGIPTAAYTASFQVTPGPYSGSGSYTLCNTYPDAVTLLLQVSASAGGWSSNASAIANCGTAGRCDTPWGPELGGGATVTRGYCGEICGVDCAPIGFSSVAGEAGDFILQPYRRVFTTSYNVYHLHLFSGATNCIGGHSPVYTPHAEYAYEVSTFTPTPTRTYTPSPSATPTVTLTPTETLTPAVTATATTCIYPPCVTPSVTAACLYPPCETQTPGYATHTPFAPTPYDTLTPLWTAYP